jgi:hypothetical protein
MIPCELPVTPLEVRLLLHCLAQVRKPQFHSLEKQNVSDLKIAGTKE